MKKIGKRILGFSIGLALLLSCFTGCGENTYGLSPKSPVALTLWHYYNGTQKVAFDNMVQEFNETVGKEKGIIIEAFSQGGVNDLTKAVKDSANKKVGAQEMPDIFGTYVDTAQEIDSMGLLASMDQYMTKEELAEYIDGYIEEGRFDAEGNLKVFPVAKSTEVLTVNETDWTKFSNATGATYDELKTWEGLVKTSEKYYTYTDSLTPQPGDGKAFFGRDALANYMIIGSKQLGQEIFKAEGGQVTLNLDKNALRKLWDNLYVPYLKGYFTKKGRFASDDAKTGDIIAAVGSSTSASYFPKQVTKENDESYPIDCKVLPLPNFSGCAPFAVQQGAGMAVKKSEPAKEYASVIFLKWFTEAERNIAFASETNYLPVKKEASTPEMVNSVLETQGKVLPKVTNDTLQVALEQTKAYTLYTNKAFKNGFEARSVLENCIIDTALKDKSQVQELIMQGKTREEAMIQYLSDSNFENWLQQLEKDLNTVLAK